MNKFTYALALGAGLVLSLAAPTAPAAASTIVQKLSTPTMSASQFNSLFPPSPACAAHVDLRLHEHAERGRRGVAGVHGHGRGRRGCMPTPISSASTTVRRRQRQPTSRQQRLDAVQRDAGRHRLHAHGLRTSSAYVVTDGQVGGINLPQAAPGQRRSRLPSSIAWLPGSKTGSLTFQYLDPTTNTGPLRAGANERHGRRDLDPAVHVTSRSASRIRTRRRSIPRPTRRRAARSTRFPCPSRPPSWPGPA